MLQLGPSAASIRVAQIASLARLRAAQHAAAQASPGEPDRVWAEVLLSLGAGSWSQVFQISGGRASAVTAPVWIPAPPLRIPQAQDRPR